MPRQPNVSAGLLLFRRVGSRLEFFLAHPGGPFWRNKEEGAWTIPKGVVEEGEVPLAAAIREFEEETGVRPSGPYLDLGAVRQKGGKIVHAWAWEGSADPERIVSNESRMEWPRNSGRWISYPEIDRCGWFGREQAQYLMNPAQVAFLERVRATVERGQAEKGPTVERE